MPSRSFVDLKSPVASCSTAVTETVAASTVPATAPAKEAEEVQYPAVNIAHPAALLPPSSTNQHLVTNIPRVYSRIYVGKRKASSYKSDSLQLSTSLVVPDLDPVYNLSCATKYFTAQRVFSRCASSSSSSSSSTRFSRHCAPTAPSIFSIVFYWHVISVLTCLMLTGFSVRASILNDFMSNISAVMLPSSSSANQNPLLRHLRSTDQKDKCFVWTLSSTKELCGLKPLERLKKLKTMLIFNHDCEETDNIKVAQLFKIDLAVSPSTRVDLAKRLLHVKDGENGRDCLLANGSECEACFQRLNTAFTNVDKAYVSLNTTLGRFDCMRAYDMSTATRPFSSVGSCYTCKIWYRYWLLLHSANLLVDPPCIDWCDYAQRACPYLATLKSADFAGHPSFQCRDWYISSIADNSNIFDLGIFSKREMTRCDCLHPCDLLANNPRVPLKAEKNFLSVYQCRDRQRQCSPVRHSVASQQKPRNTTTTTVKPRLQSTRPSTKSSPTRRMDNHSGRTVGALPKKESSASSVACPRMNHPALLLFIFLLLHLLRRLPTLEQI